MVRAQKTFFWSFPDVIIRTSYFNFHLPNPNRQFWENVHNPTLDFLTTDIVGPVGAALGLYMIVSNILNLVCSFVAPQNVFFFML